MQVKKLLLALFVLLIVVPAPGYSMTHEWSKGFSGTSSLDAFDCAVDCNGNVVLLGRNMGQVDFGGGVLPLETEIYLVKLDALGNHVWSLGFEGNDTGVGRSVAEDLLGNIYITGYFQGTLNLGGASLICPYDDDFDIFLAKFDAEGNHLWSRRFGGGGIQCSWSIAVDYAYQVCITGYFESSLNFGGETLTASSNHDIFLAKFDTDGTHIWSHDYGTSTANGRSVAFDQDGNVVVVGDFWRDLDFGGGVLPYTSYEDVFIAKLDPDGNHLWSHAYGSDVPYSRQKARSVAVDTDGNVVMTGTFEDAMTFEGVTHTGLGYEDIFVARFDADGNYLWSHGYSNDEDKDTWDIATDYMENIFLTGEMNGDMDFGGGSIPESGGGDAFILELDAGGNHVWSQSFGDNREQTGESMATDASGNVHMFGEYSSYINLGGEDFTGSGVYIVKFTALPVATTLRAIQNRWAEDHVEVSWCLNDPPDALSFIVLRGEAGTAYAPIAHPQILQEESEYILLDYQVERDRKYQYHIEILGAGGTVASFETQISTPPLSGGLGQNYPNPFHLTTSFPYDVAANGRVTIRIFDVSGRLVRTLIDRFEPAGSRTVGWDGRSDDGNLVPSGVYFCKIKIPGCVQARRMVRIR
jgi:hypothetical protein